MSVLSAGYEEKIKQHTSQAKRAVKGVLVFFIELLMPKSTDSQTGTVHAISDLA